MPQLRKSHFLSLLLALSFFYALIPTEGETSTFPLIVRTVAAIALLVLSSLNIKQLRLHYCSPLFFILAYFIVLCLISFSLKYFATSIAALAGFVWSLAYYQNNKFRVAATLALDFLIYGSIVFLLLQFSEFYLTGRLFDYHNLLFPWSEARTPLWSGLARVGGFYIEPGTYANWIYTYLLLRFFLAKEVSFLMLSLVCITMLFSMSAWGIIIGAYVFIACLFRKPDFRFSLVLSGVVAVAALSSFFIDYQDVFDFLEDQFFYSGSRDVRDDAIAEFIRVLPDVLVLGLGFDKMFCVACTSPQDAGVLISAITAFGLIFSILFFGIIFRYAYLHGGSRLVTICFPLLNTKLFYWDYILWLIFMVSLVGLLTLRGNRGGPH